jgi:DNA/RNA-binding domain of Phe-tRNA-synthetase-like protein
MCEFTFAGPGTHIVKILSAKSLLRYYILQYMELPSHIIITVAFQTMIVEKPMLSISATDDWRSAHPGAIIGLLELSGAENPSASPALDDRKRETEARLRTRYQGFTRQDFLSLPVMAAYERYYKQFNKTYHVQLQIESIVQKGKDLPGVSPLVDANFMAEVETLVLTAGHDVARLFEPVWIDVSREGDQMIQMNGASKAIRAGDMIMRDGQGISCSILYGQDNRSPISASTSHVLYVAYAPAGVSAEAVEAQLQKIEENVRLFAPRAVLAQRRLLSA